MLTIGLYSFIYLFVCLFFNNKKKIDRLVNHGHLDISCGTTPLVTESTPVAAKFEAIPTHCEMALRVHDAQVVAQDLMNKLFANVSVILYLYA
jgi:hypothetical protein